MDLIEFLGSFETKNNQNAKETEMRKEVITHYIWKRKSSYKE